MKVVLTLLVVTVGIGAISSWDALDDDCSKFMSKYPKPLKVQRFDKGGMRTETWVYENSSVYFEWKEDVFMSCKITTEKLE